MAKTAKSKKAKGTRLEQWVAAELRRSGADKEAKRMPGSGAFQFFKGDIHTRLPYSFEVKNQETTKVWEWYEQAKSQASGLEKPIVIFSRNYSQPMALLSATDLIDILAELEDYKRMWHKD